MRPRSKTFSVKPTQKNLFQNNSINPITIDIQQRNNGSLFIDIDSYLHVDYNSSTTSNSESITNSFQNFEIDEIDSHAKKEKKESFKIPSKSLNLPIGMKQNSMLPFV